MHPPGRLVVAFPGVGIGGSEALAFLHVPGKQVPGTVDALPSEGLDERIEPVSSWTSAYTVAVSQSRARTAPFFHPTAIVASLEDSVQGSGALLESMVRSCPRRNRVPTAYLRLAGAYTTPADQATRVRRSSMGRPA